jgi:long-subunit acyl-CoA synthetase (AMP-forming)
MEGLEELLGEWTNKTLADLFDQAVVKYSEEEAIVFIEERVTYRELHRRVSNFAKGLLKLGIKKGDKVGIWLSNRPEWAITEFAVAKVGAVMVPLSTRFRAFDVEYILKQSDSTTLVMTDFFLKNNYLEVIQEICPELGIEIEKVALTKKYHLLKRETVSRNVQFSRSHERRKRSLYGWLTEKNGGLSEVK